MSVLLEHKPDCYQEFVYALLNRINDCRSVRSDYELYFWKNTLQVFQYCLLPLRMKMKVNLIN